MHLDYYQARRNAQSCCQRHQAAPATLPRSLDAEAQSKAPAVSGKAWRLARKKPVKRIWQRSLAGGTLLSSGIRRALRRAMAL